MPMPLPRAPIGLCRLRARAAPQVADLLLEWACLAEQVLRSPTAAADLAAECDAYLASPVRYQDGKLLDAQGEAVMMRWEAPLMAAHANLLCQNGGHILNVGFGMGLIDEAIQTCVHADRAMRFDACPACAAAEGGDW